MFVSAPAYLVGREFTEFPREPGTLSDRVFAAERLDGINVNDYRFEHCTFANISFKDTHVTGSHFDHCVFIGCYFRKTLLRDSSFVGARFVACDFPRISVHSSDFRYAHFDRCAISSAELQHSLPSEPNLREELARNLAIAAAGSGMAADARQYRLTAIEALQEHLSAGVQGDSTWYRDHYKGTRRIQAAVQLLGSKLNGLLWGHGEKPWVVIVNILLAGVILFPIPLWLMRNWYLVNGEAPTIPAAIWLSVMTLVPVGGMHSITTSSMTVRALLAIESLVGLVLIALLGALVLRRVIGK